MAQCAVRCAYIFPNGRQCEALCTLPANHKIGSPHVCIASHKSGAAAGICGVPHLWSTETHHECGSNCQLGVEHWGLHTCVHNHKY
jgi:hypothetical protein